MYETYFFSFYPFLKKVIGIYLLIGLVSFPAFSHVKRDLLTAYYSKEDIRNSIIMDNSWIKYPLYTARDEWRKIPETQRNKTIEEAEKYLGYKWPTISATMYLEFTRSGNRAIVESVLYQRLEVLRILALAELMEGRKRFMDDIINGVFQLCEQTYWGMPSAFYMYKSGFKDLNRPNTILPDVNDPIIDLYVADTAGDLAWIWYFFHEEFDKISPIISARLKSELEKKVLIPFYERSDFWWLTGWGKGDVNNWTPWCNYNILSCIMLIEDDPFKKVDGIYKTMSSVDLFINSYSDDGSCEEGPNYWGVAGGKLFDYLLLLKQITKGKINIFDEEIIKNIGRYIYRVYISSAGLRGQYYTNYSDSPPIIKHDAGRVYRYGREVNDPSLRSFGVFLLRELNFEKESISGRIGEALENLFDIEGWQKYSPIEPLFPQFYFSDGELAIGREKNNAKEGFYFFAKGGNNGVSHNHNDVGSCILFFNGLPVLIDVGVGMYSAKTFSRERYTIWTMQSEYHNLPVINGYGQNAGSQHKAQNSRFIPSYQKVSFSTDISLSYPKEAKINKWVRTYSMDRVKNKFTINDVYHLDEIKGNTTMHFMTPLSCYLITPGLLEFKGNGFVLNAKYDSLALDAQIETIKIEDSMLQQMWGNNLFRIKFNVKNKKMLGDITIEIFERSMKTY